MSRIKKFIELECKFSIVTFQVTQPPYLFILYLLHSATNAFNTLSKLNIEAFHVMLLNLQYLEPFIHSIYSFE